MDEIKELQTLTTTKGVYNSFPDLTARKGLKAKLNAPGNVKVGDYLRVKSVGADGTVVVEGTEGPEPDSGQNPNKTYHAIGILGDSYSAYAGWIPDGYQPSYGVDNYNGVTSVRQMWWWILANRIGATILRDSSYSGSTICNSGYNGADATETSYLTRAAADFGADKVLEPKPDLIIIFGATNDDWAGTALGEAKYADWTADDLKTVAPAFCKLISDLTEYNPGADIVFVLNSDLRATMDAKLQEICTHYSIQCVVLEGIEKTSGHPTVTGMEQIAAQIQSALGQYSGGSDDSSGSGDSGGSDNSGGSDDSGDSGDAGELFLSTLDAAETEFKQTIPLEWNGNPVVPVVIAPDLDTENHTCRLSGQSVVRCQFKTKEAGTVTIGKVDLTTFGNGAVPVLIDPVTFTATGSGLQDFPYKADLGVNESIGVLALTDTTVLYARSVGAVTQASDLYVITADTWNTGSESWWDLYGAVYVKSGSGGDDSGNGDGLTVISTKTFNWDVTTAADIPYETHEVNWLAGDTIRVEYNCLTEGGDPGLFYIGVNYQNGILKLERNTAGEVILTEDVTELATYVTKCATTPAAVEVIITQLRAV